jgi:hypothetical protein
MTQNNPNVSGFLDNDLAVFCSCFLSLRTLYNWNPREKLAALLVRASFSQATILDEQETNFPSVQRAI